MDQDTTVAVVPRTRLRGGDAEAVRQAKLALGGPRAPWTEALPAIARAALATQVPDGTLHLLESFAEILRGLAEQERRNLSGTGPDELRSALARLAVRSPSAGRSGVAGSADARLAQAYRTITAERRAVSASNLARVACTNHYTAERWLKMHGAAAAAAKDAPPDGETADDHLAAAMARLAGGIVTPGRLARSARTTTAAAAAYLRKIQRA